MKKNIIIWGMAVILILVAVYTAKGFNKTSVNNSNGDKKTNSGTITSQGNSDGNQTAAGGSSQSQDSSSPKKIKAPDFTLKDFDGKDVSLSDFKGKKVFLNFWATWCPPCRGEMPDIEKIYQENKDNKDFVIIAVNLGEDKGTVKNFMEQNKYNFKGLLDTNQNAGSLYNITAIPTSFFIDSDGYAVKMRRGAMREEEMREYIKAIGN